MLGCAAAPAVRAQDLVSVSATAVTDDRLPASRVALRDVTVTTDVVYSTSAGWMSRRPPALPLVDDGGTHHLRLVLGDQKHPVPPPANLGAVASS